MCLRAVADYLRPVRQRVKPSGSAFAGSPPRRTDPGVAQLKVSAEEDEWLSSLTDRLFRPLASDGLLSHFVPSIKDELHRRCFTIELAVQCAAELETAEARDAAPRRSAHGVDPAQALPGPDARMPASALDAPQGYLVDDEEALAGVSVWDSLMPDPEDLASLDRDPFASPPTSAQLVPQRPATPASWARAEAHAPQHSHGRHGATPDVLGQHGDASQRREPLMPPPMRRDDAASMWTHRRDLNDPLAMAEIEVRCDALPCSRRCWPCRARGAAGRTIALATLSWRGGKGGGEVAACNGDAACRQLVNRSAARPLLVYSFGSRDDAATPFVPVCLRRVQAPRLCMAPYV